MGSPSWQGLEAADLDRVPASVAAWSLAAKLALELVARERIIPHPRADRGEAEARWGVSLSLPDDAGRFAHLARALPPSAYAVPVDGEEPPRARRGRRPRDGVKVWAPEALLTEFLDATVDALVRQGAARTPIRGRAGERGRWEGRFVAALTGTDASFPTEGFLERALLDELARWATPARGVLAAQTPQPSQRPADPP